MGTSFIIVVFFLVGTMSLAINPRPHEFLQHVAEGDMQGIGSDK